MSEATTFFNRLIHRSLMSINTMMPCSVLTYDKANRLAKVQPLFMTKEYGFEPEALPPIEGVPVLFQRFEFIDMDQGNKTVVRDFTPVLNAGDIVMVGFAQRALDNVSSGKVAYPSINRSHDLQDAFVMGVWK